jgi:hypothetical protein
MSEEKSSAAMAAKRVQAIVEAAEATARDIEDKARAEAAARVAEVQRRMDEINAAMAADLRATASAPLPADPPPAPAVAAEPEPVAEPEPPEPEPEPEPAPAAPAVKAPEGARLIALNMALSGKPRDETAAYLRENFALDDSDGLLDEVYAKAGS